MSRIKLLNAPEDLSPEQRAVFDAIVAGPRGKLQGPLMAALHNPDLADRWQKLGAALRYETSLSRQISELVILVTAKAWACQLEWYLHEDFARSAGLSQRTIDAIKSDERHEIEGIDLLEAYDFCAELMKTKRVSPDVYARVLQRFGTIGVVEMTALAGYYTMVAMTLNAHEFPSPPDAVRPFPEYET